MLNKISQFTIKLSSILLSLLLLLNLPYLFITQQGFTFQPIYFFNQIVTMLKQVFSPESLVIIGSDPKFGHFVNVKINMYIFACLSMYKINHF
ncbi:hypothetical protein P9012_24485, partial [Bacillus thuringiensis]|nr:hypothetical protein [Bacillus thuringiensis]